MKASTLFTAILAAGLLGSPAAQAQVLNPNFDLNLSGWSVIGDVGVRNQAAYLTTAFSGLPGDDDEVNFNYSGNDIVSSFDLEEFAGLTFGALDPDALNSIFAFEGSALKQTFNVQAGESIAFAWQLFTNDVGGSDFAFAVINGEIFTLGTSAGASTFPGTYGFSAETGLGFFASTPFATAQSVTLTIGVADAGLDGVVSSALSVDSVAVVPEPASAGLLGGAALLGLILRRRRQA